MLANRGSGLRSVRADCPNGNETWETRESVSTTFDFNADGVGIRQEFCREFHTTETLTGRILSLESQNFQLPRFKKIKKSESKSDGISEGQVLLTFLITTALVVLKIFDARTVIPASIYRSHDSSAQGKSHF